MTFTQFLRTQKKERGAIGDFAREWVTDQGRGKPRGYKHFSAIEKYLNSVGACDAAIEAGRKAWDKWKLQTD